ncbi:histone H1 protein [Candidatus Saccharibacteria bacterium]|nr:histone H1 protein [Candidatus Saccharibacteria bacterium]NCU40457.1 histone H1 protein [Candidatus Saccharibacteria bacterium]
MPIIKSAIKRMRQTAKRRDRNVETKKSMKTAVKAFLEKPSAKGLSSAQSKIDTAVKKNLIEKRTAARRKSSLVKIAKDAGVKMETAKKTTKKAVAAKKTVAPKKSVAVKKPVAAKKSTTVKKPVAAKKPVTAKKVAPAKKSVAVKKPVAAKK